MKKVALVIAGLVVLILGSGLFADRSNPPVEHEVKWDSDYTKTQFMASCADCHSHETKWPWYSYVGPSAFLVAHHVEEGREHFNISVANMNEAYESAEEVEEHKMPLEDYLTMHPEAVIPPDKFEEFVAGLKKTFPPEKEGHHEEHDEHEEH